MKLSIFIAVISNTLLSGCVVIAHHTSQQTIDSYRFQSHRSVCHQVASTTPTTNSALLTFQRAGNDLRAPIIVHLAWQPSADPIYSSRGPMLAISVSEGSHAANIPLPTIHSVETLREIEDLWPDYVELSSPRPGDYDLLLFNGVPAGEGATLVEFHHDTLHSVSNLVSEHFQKSLYTAFRVG